MRVAPRCKLLQLVNTVTACTACTLLTLLNHCFHRLYVLLLTLLTMITQWHGNMPTYMVTNRWLKRCCYDMVILLFAGKYCHCLHY